MGRLGKGRWLPFLLLPATLSQLPTEELARYAPLPSPPPSPRYINPPPPPPGPPTDAAIDYEYVASSNARLEYASVLQSDWTVGLEPTLDRAMYTTPWLDRDHAHVTAERDLAGTEWLRAGSPKTALAGSEQERLNLVYLSRHGLYRRTDAKFNEFVARPTGSPQDGYGLWRYWESHGRCPYELLIADPWGTLVWQGAPDGRLRAFECSWVVRPGMYRHMGYFKLSRAPVTLSFKSFLLVSPVELLTIYDGAHPDAQMLGRFTGAHVPDQITSTGPDVRIVLTSHLNRTAEDTWTELRRTIAEDRLDAAIAEFIIAARSDLIGFYRQDMRRILRTLARREATRPENGWIRHKWFAGDGTGFDRAFNDSLTYVLEDMSSWEKRARNQVGKEHINWDRRVSPRRYPGPVEMPEKNPYYAAATGNRVGRGEVDADGLVEVQRHLGVMPRRPSGFSLDFTTTADCHGRGITPYGIGMLPPITRSTEMHSRSSSNFLYQPMPLEPSSCQAMVITGPQTTRDRPFSIADNMMKLENEKQMERCIPPGSCDVRIGGERGFNCSAACNPFFACVHNNMANRSLWRIGPHLYNKSLVARARQQCLQLPLADQCVDVDQRTVGSIRPGGPGGTNRLVSMALRTLADPKSAGCLAFTCASCAVTIFDAFFRCAILCGQNIANPVPDCIDCSYQFDDVYDGIDRTRDRLWEAYFSGAFGFTMCPRCNVNEQSMIDAYTPMSMECRRCHYAIEDFLNSDVFACNDAQANSLRCFSLNRTHYNYMQDFFGELRPGSEILDLTFAGTYVPTQQEIDQYARPPPPPNAAG